MNGIPHPLVQGGPDHRGRPWEASERKTAGPAPRPPQPAQAQPLPSDDIGRMIEQARWAAAAKEG